MSERLSETLPQSLPLLEQRVAIHEIVQYGEYIEQTKIETTEFTVALEKAIITVYDSFNYYTDNNYVEGFSTSNFGVTITYKDPQENWSTDSLIFVGVDEKPYVDLEGHDRQVATEDNARMFIPLLKYVKGTLSSTPKPPTPVRTWRGNDARYKPELGYERSQAIAERQREIEREEEYRRAYEEAYVEPY